MIGHWRSLPRLPRSPVGVAPVRADASRARLRGIGNLALLVATLAVGLFLRTAVVATTLVVGSSMADTLHPGDLLLVWRHPAVLAPGAIVLVHRPAPEATVLVKRIVAGPGATVELSAAQLIVDGVPQPLPAAGHAGTATYGPVRVPPGAYFVLGDNRPASRDSRSFGPVPAASIAGEVFFRLLPLGAAGPIERAR